MELSILRLSCQAGFSPFKFFNLLKEGFKHALFDFVGKLNSVNFMLFHKRYEYSKLYITFGGKEAQNGIQELSRKKPGKII